MRAIAELYRQSPIFGEQSIFTLAVAHFLCRKDRIIMENKPIKQVMKENHIPQWKVAEHIGMSEFVFSRKLRREPDGNFRQQILDAIQALK